MCERQQLGELSISEKVSQTLRYADSAGHARLSLA